MSALATSPFTGANENPLSEGGVWSSQTSETGLERFSNAGRSPDDSNDHASNYNAITWPADHYSKSKLTATAGYTSHDGPGSGLRMSASAPTYYRVLFNHLASGNIAFGYKIAGSFTPITTRTQAWTNGDECYGEIQGSTIQAKINGVNAGASVSDSTISAAGRAGLAYSSEGGGQGGTWDDWEGGDFAGAGFDPSTVPWVADMPADRALAVVGF